jgi:hypothetical protein
MGWDHLMFFFKSSSLFPSNKKEFRQRPSLAQGLHKSLLGCHQPPAVSPWIKRGWKMPERKGGL